MTWHAKYVLLDVLFGLAPLVLVALGLTTWDVLAFVSAAVACVLLLALLVFMREQLVAEIRKALLGVVGHGAGVGRPCPAVPRAPHATAPCAGVVYRVPSPFSNGANARATTSCPGRGVSRLTTAR